MDYSAESTESLVFEAVLPCCLCLRFVVNVTRQMHRVMYSKPVVTDLQISPIEYIVALGRYSLLMHTELRLMTACQVRSCAARLG